MSKYSEYDCELKRTANSLVEISKILNLLRNIKRKREELVPSNIGNKQYNINIANDALDIAKKKYDLAMETISMCNLMPTNWIPSFEALKELSETSENIDV